MNEATTESKNQLGREYLTKVVLIMVFLLGLAAFFIVVGTDRLLQAVQSWTWLDFLLLGLAVHRMGRMVAYDRVMEPVRYPFTKTVPDLSGLGDTVVPRGEGMIRSLGQLLSCPICAGTWISAGLVVFLVLLPVPARIFLWILGAVGLAELIFAATEVMTWSGYARRAQAGEICAKRLPDAPARTGGAASKSSNSEEHTRREDTQPQKTR